MSVPVSLMKTSELIDELAQISAVKVHYGSAAVLRPFRTAMPSPQYFSDEMQAAFSALEKRYVELSVELDRRLPVPHDL